jgi:hypothetical protein
VRTVDLDREILAALLGALRPGGADLGAVDIDPMARCVVIGLVGLGDDAVAALAYAGASFSSLLETDILCGP